MKPKTFWILFIFLCIVASITYFVFYHPQPDTRVSRMGETLFKDLAVNRIAEVHITRYENENLETIKLSKKDSAWIVENLFDYYADFTSILELVEKLKNAKIGRHFEASPDTLSRLALHDPAEHNIGQDEKSIRVRIFDGEQGTLVDVLVGKHRESSGINGGHYLKPTEQNTIYLVDQTFQFIGRHSQDWIKSELLDIPAENIETVTCLNPEDQSIVYKIKRHEKGAPPELQDADDTRSIKTHRVESVFDTLSSLSISNVAAKLEGISEEITGFNSLPVLDFALFDGNVYRVYTGKKAVGENNGEYNGFYFKIDGPQKSSWIYVISEWVNQSIVTDPEMFFEKMEDNP
ncbi:MAG: DUF4340 domain-containing protein [Desulfobacterales bacterium]